MCLCPKPGVSEWWGVGAGIEVPFLLSKLYTHRHNFRKPVWYWRKAVQRHHLYSLCHSHLPRTPTLSLSVEMEWLQPAGWAETVPSSLTVKHPMPGTVIAQLTLVSWADWKHSPWFQGAHNLLQTGRWINSHSDIVVSDSIEMYS